MYAYYFVFYKPGKRNYTQEEVFLLFNHLGRRGFELHGQFNAPGQIVDHVKLDLMKSGREFSLLLGPAEERLHGRLGQLAISEEQFEENPKENTELFLTAAHIISSEIKPLFAWGDHELEIGRLEPFLRFDRVSALAWANIFNRELVERFGGVKRFLFQLTPEKEKELQRRLEDELFLPIQLANLPTETTDGWMAWNIHHLFPEAMFRSFEIPSAKAIERAE